MSDDRRFPILPPDEHYRHQARLAGTACRGLDLPADVKAGAVKRLVESVLATTHFIPYGDAESLYAALAELGIK